jgi:hypothetical protein
MPISRERAQARGRIGALTKAALATDRSALTQAARDARWQSYLDQIPSEITDPGERQRRAGMLRAADLQRMSLRSSVARQRASEAARAEQELLDATGLLDVGSDGIDA